MKFEKREITLNEYDSLKDMHYMEKILFLEYEKDLESVERKETSETIKTLMQETKNEIENMAELMRKSFKNRC